MKIKTFGGVDERSLKQLERCMEAGHAEFGVLCADHHPGYSQPIGGAVAYEGYISPSGAGFDIGCGNKAAQTDLSRADLVSLGGVERVMSEITRRISFGMGVPATERVDHPVLERIRNADFGPQRKLSKLAADQLGTVGSGNHYVNVMEDEDGKIWIGVHFGSRGFGHKTATGFFALAQGLSFEARVREGGMDSPPVLFEADSELGESYISAMQLAGEYAYAGRDVVVDKVLDILGAKSTHEVHNHHNFCIAGSEKVQTPSGFTRMRDVRVGDAVFAFDQQHGLVETRVARAWRTGVKPIYSIATSNRRIRCSGDHPILTIELTRDAHPTRGWHDKTQGALTWRAAEEIRVGDLVVCAEAPTANGESVGLDRARLIGALLGDGWIRSDPRRQGYTVGLAIGDSHESHTDRYLALCQRELPASWRNNAPGHFGLTCSSKQAYEHVLELGVTLRSRQKELPAIAFALPRAEKLALLSGYFDADGSVASSTTTNHGRGTIASVSVALVEGLRELAIRCGLRVTNPSKERRSTNLGACVVYRCVVSVASMAQLELWHEGKRRKIRSAGRGEPGLAADKIGYVELPPNVFAQRVRRVEHESPEAVYDLSIEHSSHAFLCEGLVVHNCWLEEHFGRSYWVIRKGCTPARPGQEGFVGASMGEESVVLEGVDSGDAAESLYSTVHGAGRVMSRSQAAGRFRRGRQIKPGVVDWPAVQSRLREQGIVLVGGGADEAPEVYKRLPQVLDAHGDSIRVKHWLRPLGVAMAGRDVVDPYKD